MTHCTEGHRPAHILRPPTGADINLIVQTYVRGSDRALWPHERLPTTEWAPIAERFAAQCLASRHALVCAARDSDVVLGYALGHRDGADRAILHWVHVRGLYRKRGVARMLVEQLTKGAGEVLVTHTCDRRQRATVKARGWKVADRLPWLRLLASDAA